MANELIQVDIQERVATITLNRPERLNALGADMRDRLYAALEAVERDEAARVVMITGAGRAFCSGGDVKEMNERRSAGLGPGTGRRDSGPTPIRDRILVKLQTLPKPVIAAVNGVAAGAGMNLALACDLRIASERAAFGQVFVKRGLHPSWGGTYFLPRLVGLAKALELIWSGEMVPAAEALRLGMVNRVMPHEAFAEEAREFAQALAEGPPLAMGLAKRGVYRSLGADLAAALEYETYAQQIVWASEDAGEGIRAFVEKRVPDFRGD